MEPRILERGVSQQLLGGGILERGVSLKVNINDPTMSFRKRRASLMPSKLGPASLAPAGSTTGTAISDRQRPGSSLNYAGRGEARRAHTSLGFSDSRERGRLPPRLAYIQSATYGRQSAKHARDGTDTPEAAHTPRSEASPDQKGKQSVVNQFQMERPLQYLELEQLLHSVSDKLHTSNNQTWIASSQKFARGSWPRPASRATVQSSRPASRSGKTAGESNGYNGEKGHKEKAAVASAEGARPGLLQGRVLDASEGDAGEKGGNPLKEFRPSKESMDILPKSRGEKVDRTQSVMTGKEPSPITDDQVLRPIRKKPKSVDELDMQAKQAEYASHPPAALNKGETFKIGHVQGMFPDSVDDPVLRGLTRQKANLDPLQVVLPTDSAHVRDQLRRFAYGHANKRAPMCTLLPPAKNYVWREELKRTRKAHFAATLVQNMWRSWQRRKKYLKYSINNLSRKSKRMRNIMTVWLRASRQREHEHPPGSNVRGLMSYWLIRFNVSVQNAKIARDKAADCRDLWSSIWLKRVVQCWRKIVDIISFDRHHRMHTWLVPWKDFYSDFCLVREAARKTQRRFLHAALRCLLFYARCSAKLKLRASKLFRLEEESVYELLMPIQRFPGYFSLFQPNEILEKFRRKDWYERRVYRQCYKRRIPWAFTLWNTVADGGRKWRVVVGAYDRLVLNKAFSAFCFLLELDDHGHRVHLEVDAEINEEKRLEEEATKKLVVQEDAIKELETSIDNLSGLVDYEHREMMRKLVRDEKHKTMFRIRYDALDKDRKNVGILLAQVSDDLEASEMEQKAAEEAALEKRREHDELVDVLRLEESTKWDKNLQNVYNLFMRATDIMGNALEKAKRARRARVFRICWRTLCKPAFRVRLRRVLNRAHITRLLKICFQFLKMERSIYKYYPLRVKFYAMLRWFKQVEFKYQHTSYGLKTRVRRRQDLYMALDRALRAFIGAQTFARTPQKQEFHTPSFVILRWKEHVQSVVARREVVRLFHRQRAIHVASRCFDMMKHGVPWSVRMEGPDAAPPRFLEIQAGCDLLVWKRDYFCGVSYARVLRHAERRGRRAALNSVRKGPSLVKGLKERHSQVLVRLKHESRLLMRYFEEVDVVDDASSQGLSSFEAYPAWCWGTVLNLRHQETMTLLEHCNELARKAKFEFDSISVGLNLSNWLFKIRCHELPEADAAKLPASKRYWKHIDKLFTVARQAIAAKGNVR